MSSKARATFASPSGQDPLFAAAETIKAAATARRLEASGDEVVVLLRRIDQNTAGLGRLLGKAPEKAARVRSQREIPARASREVKPDAPPKPAARAKATHKPGSERESKPERVQAARAAPAKRPAAKTPPPDAEARKSARQLGREISPPEQRQAKPAFTRPATEPVAPTEAAFAQAAPTEAKVRSAEVAQEHREQGRLERLFKAVFRHAGQDGERENLSLTGKNEAGNLAGSATGGVFYSAAMELKEKFEGAFDKDTLTGRAARWVGRKTGLTPAAKKAASWAGEKTGVSRWLREVREEQEGKPQAGGRDAKGRFVGEAAASKPTKPEAPAAQATAMPGPWKRMLSLLRGGQQQAAKAAEATQDRLGELGQSVGDADAEARKSARQLGREIRENAAGGQGSKGGGLLDSLARYRERGRGQGPDLGSARGERVRGTVAAPGKPQGRLRRAAGRAGRGLKAAGWVAADYLGAGPLLDALDTYQGAQDALPEAPTPRADRAGKPGGKLGRARNLLKGRRGKVGLALGALGALGIGGTAYAMSGDGGSADPTEKTAAQLFDEDMKKRHGQKAAPAVAATPAPAPAPTTPVAAKPTAPVVQSAAAVSPETLDNVGMLGTATGIGSKLVKGLRVLGPIGAAISTGVDAVSGFTDEDMHKRAFGLKGGQEATLGQKSASALANVLDLGGLVSGAAGLLGADFSTADMASGIYRMATAGDADKAFGLKEGQSPTLGQSAASMAAKTLDVGGVPSALLRMLGSDVDTGDLAKSIYGAFGGKAEALGREGAEADSADFMAGMPTPDAVAEQSGKAIIDYLAKAMGLDSGAMAAGGGGGIFSGWFGDEAPAAKAAPVVSAPAMPVVSSPVASNLSVRPARDPSPIKTDSSAAGGKQASMTATVDPVALAKAMQAAQGSSQAQSVSRESAAPDGRMGAQDRPDATISQVPAGYSDPLLTLMSLGRV